MVWYMGLDENNKPNGWDIEPWGNAFEVSQEIRDIHIAHPEYIWNGETLVPVVIPEPEVFIYIPTQITMRQTRLQLAIMGIYADVNTAVSTMGELALIEWEYASVLERSNPLVQGMIQMLGWSESQADDFFIAANKL